MTRVARPAAALAIAAIVLGLDPRARVAAAPPRAGLTMALTGDSIITMKLSVHAEPQFLKMIELIRGADVAFTNCEMLFHDYEPYPMTVSGGTYMRADPTLAKELAWAGFDMVARANNHANDYGVEGMRLTTKYVAAAGLVQAGVGDSLRQAREAKYFDSPNGRIALVSVASTFPDASRAGESWGDTRARPGLSPLRFKTTYVLTRREFDDLRKALDEAGQLPPPSKDRPVPADEMTVLGRHFIVGNRRETRTEPLKEDLDALSAVVSNASREADYVIVSSHTHEAGGDRYTPPAFFVAFAHAMIDAGASVVTASGPHVLRGIEIYKGRPIFYSLGNFIFENETLLRQPPENYAEVGLAPGSGVADFNDQRSDHDRKGWPPDEPIWESVIAMPRFEDGALTEIRLYPITLGFRRPRPDRGWPTLADPPLGRKIIDDLARMSTPFGTRVELVDGVGLVRGGPARTAR